MFSSIVAFLTSAWTWIQTPAGVGILIALGSISEVLGTMEFFKKSSIFSYVVSALKWIKEKASK